MARDELTPYVLHAQRDLPAVRAVLLDQNDQQIGATAYSFAALRLVLQWLLKKPETAQRYGLTESTVQSRLDCTRAIAQQAGLHENLCRLDTERLVVMRIMSMFTNTRRPGTSYKIEVLDMSPEEKARRGVLFSGSVANALYLMRGEVSLEDSVVIYSKKMLRFVMSMGATRPGLKRYEVQELAVIHARVIVEVLDLFPHSALPDMHPTQDKVLLSRMSNECGEDLLPKFINYKPPIG